MRQTKRLVVAWTLIGGMVCPTLAQNARSESGLAADAELVETRSAAPKLKTAAPYQVKDGVVEIELSKYAGYSGLVVANGGLAPSDSSVFAKKYGFKLKITLSEEESWSALNSGKLAAAATTVDVLAAYGRQFQVQVPALIGFSRGADGIVVRSGIRKVNDLKGKVLSATQFTESDFLIRYLSQEANIQVNMLADLAARPDPQKINLVYCEDGFGAGDIFLRDLKAGRNRIAGCVTWAPKTTEVAEGSGGKAHVLVTNTNLLIVADVLVVNAGFAKAEPRMVAGLVEGILQGNTMVRSNASAHLDVIARAFGWKPDEARSELAKVHLANHPENEAFFAGTLDSAGSFEYIYETAGYVYGKELAGEPADMSRLVNTAHLKSLAAEPAYKGQKADIVPVRGKGNTAESDELVSLLSKDIRFKFLPNSAKLDMANAENKKGLESISQLVRVSPGSRVLLRGHADGTLARQAREGGNEARARELMVQLKALSRSRCVEVKQVLEEKFRMAADRMEAQGVGADEPTGQGADADRRVEVQWMVLE
jgi:NitT/TauT family transport system substrate-binding protein